MKKRPWFESPLDPFHHQRHVTSAIDAQVKIVKSCSV
jgi:hypothetical protein